MSKFSDKLHGIPSFAGTKVQSVVLGSDEGKLTVNLVTDTTYTQPDRNALDAVLKDMVPSLFTYELEITKVRPDCDIVRNRAYELAREMSPMISATLEPGDVEVKSDGETFDVAVNLSGPVPSKEKQDFVRSELAKSFCQEINVAFAEKQTEETPEGDRKPDFVVSHAAKARTFKITNFKPIESKISETPEEAVYIQDVLMPAEEVVLCGVVTSAECIEYEKKTTGEKKNLFAFRISDGTATVRVTCFPRKPSYDHIAAIKEGDSIVCTCIAEIREGSLSFKTKRIDYGSAPDGFVPEKKQSKPVPQSYEHIKPEPYFDETQTDFFTDRSVPDSVRNDVFVVLDLETTGRNSVAANGMMDSIIELAACKIEGGEITETFSTLINPERKLSQDIVNLTGIKDEMLEGAPVYEDVLPDFFKFCDGACLVGHNIEGFDIKFLDYYWETLGYIRENRIEDTLELAHRVLPGLKNYKLPTIGEQYGYTFGKENTHHRALNDTVVTAKIYLDMKRDESRQA